MTAFDIGPQSQYLPLARVEWGSWSLPCRHHERARPDLLIQAHNGPNDYRGRVFVRGVRILFPYAGLEMHSQLCRKNNPTSRVDDAG